MAAIKNALHVQRFMRDDTVLARASLPATSFVPLAKSEIQRRVHRKDFKQQSGTLKSRPISRWPIAQGIEQACVKYSKDTNQAFAKSDINGGLNAVHGIWAWSCHKQHPESCEYEPTLNAHLIHRWRNHPDRTRQDQGRGLTIQTFHHEFENCRRRQPIKLTTTNHQIQFPLGDIGNFLCGA